MTRRTQSKNIYQILIVNWNEILRYLSTFCKVQFISKEKLFYQLKFLPFKTKCQSRKNSSAHIKSLSHLLNKIFLQLTFDVEIMQSMLMASNSKILNYELHIKKTLGITISKNTVHGLMQPLRKNTVSSKQFKGLIDACVLSK